MAVTMVTIIRYEEAIFHRRMEAELDAHDPSQPLFLVYTAHLVHDPYEVPQSYLNAMSAAGGGPFKNDTSQDTMRMTYHAMVKYLDDAAAKLMAQLRDKGMWENTLFWFVSDNGGPIYIGGNNYPLRGGKYSEFEGGVRVAAFVSGGIIPAAKRGMRSEGIAGIADVYTTLCSLAGVSPVDTSAAAAGLPPVDGMDLSAMFLSPDPASVSVSPRDEMPLEPLSQKYLDALDEYELQLAAHNAAAAAAAAGNGSGDRKDRVAAETTTWDVHVNASCGNHAAKYKFIPSMPSMEACEAACGSDPECVQFAYAHKPKWCALNNATSYPHPNPDFDCGCKNACAPGPSPSPSPPSPGPPGPPGPKPPKKLPKCYKVEQCSVADVKPITVKGTSLNDCCSACDAMNGTAGSKICMVSVWERDRSNPNGNSNSNCSLYEAGYTQINEPNGGSCQFPSSRNKPQPPIILDQSGYIMGDLKIVTGDTVNMADYTGPHYPNSSTPVDRHGQTNVVHSFGCSTPKQPFGCLFNVSADPTEHNDLALERPDDVLMLLARLRNVSATFFNPSRGNGDKRACDRIAGPNRGFFGPWLELD